jgi:hypothetical protein
MDCDVSTDAGQPLSIISPHVAPGRGEPWSITFVVGAEPAPARAVSVCGTEALGLAHGGALLARAAAELDDKGERWAAAELGRHLRRIGYDVVRLDQGRP